MIKWRSYSFAGADAEKCWNEIQSIGGEGVEPQELVDFARNNPDSELHKCFQWDDAEAAEAWRRQQARIICGALVVVVEKDNKEPTSYRILQHDNEAKKYQPVTFTVRNEDMYSRLLKQAKEELASFRQRYKSIVELENVIEAIDEALK